MNRDPVGTGLVRDLGIYLSLIHICSPLAILRFAYEGDYVNTKFQIRTLQRNEELCLDEIVEAPVTQEDGGHTYQLTASKDPTCTCLLYTSGFPPAGQCNTAPPPRPSRPPPGPH